MVPMFENAEQAEQIAQAIFAVTMEQVKDPMARQGLAMVAHAIDVSPKAALLFIAGGCAFALLVAQGVTPETFAKHVAERLGVAL